MIKLMCSKDRQGLKNLEGELCKAGIQFEVRGNPLTAALGITRFEVHVDEGDWQTASDIWQSCLAAGGIEDMPGDLRSTRGINGFFEPAQSDLVIEAKVITAPAAPPPEDVRDGRPEPGGVTETRGDLTQATALLEAEVEALLARDAELVSRCSALEEKIKDLDEALSQSRADHDREMSQRSATEKKLAEVSQIRAALEQQVRDLELRLKKSEQTLAATQGRIEAEAQQREQLMKERQAEQLQTQAYVGTVNDLRSQIRARLAAREKKDVASSATRRRRPAVEKERTKVLQDGL